MDVVAKSAVECPVEEVKGPQLTVGSFEFGPEAKAVKFTTIDGWSLCRWPEWIALMTRLGVDLGAPTTRITIQVGCEEAVKIVHEFNGLDLNAPIGER